MNANLLDERMKKKARLALRTFGGKESERVKRIKIFRGSQILGMTALAAFCSSNFDKTI